MKNHEIFENLIYDKLTVNWK